MTTLEIIFFVLILIMLVELHWTIEKKTDIDDLTFKIREQMKEEEREESNSIESNDGDK